MSTDDLVRRARAEVPTFALVSELADEVDRLRAERDRWKARWQATVADADAARAALERVSYLVHNTPHAWITVRELDRTLRGQA